MTLRRVYLGFCVLGLLIPNSLFLPWLIEHGPDPQRFVQDMFANGVSAFFGVDVVLSAIVLGAFVIVESVRLRLRGAWLPILATFLVGVSLGLPLFLYRRQAVLDRPAP